MMGNLYGEGNSAGMHAMRNKENKVVGLLANAIATAQK
jgi:hypothetical protein